MNDQKQKLVVGFLIVGVAFIVTSVLFSIKTSTAPSALQRIARVERETGQVFVYKNSYTQKENVEKVAYIENLDSLETNDLGEALVSFENSYRVKIFENSVVTFEKGSKTINLIIKKGDLRIENFGKEGDLVIAKNGERIEAADYNSSVLSSTPTVPVAMNNSAIEKKTVGLTEEEISYVMNSYKNFFFKCYTQLLQKDPQAKGEVTISFTIENTGKISVSEATSKTLVQDDFKKCLLEVMSRIDFKVFQGPAISTLFPLKFE